MIDAGLKMVGFLCIKESSTPVTHVCRYTQANVHPLQGVGPTAMHRSCKSSGWSAAAHLCLKLLPVLNASQRILIGSGNAYFLGFQGFKSWGCLVRATASSRFIQGGKFQYHRTKVSCKPTTLHALSLGKIHGAVNGCHLEQSREHIAECSKVGRIRML